MFPGTRVPIKSLFDHLTSGDSVEDFLDGFPSVSRAQVNSLVKEACDIYLDLFEDSKPDQLACPFRIRLAPLASPCAAGC